MLYPLLHGADWLIFVFLHPLAELRYIDILKYYERWSLLRLTATQNKTSNRDLD